MKFILQGIILNKYLPKWKTPDVFYKLPEVYKIWTVHFVVLLNNKRIGVTNLKTLFPPMVYIPYIYILQTDLI